MKKTVQLVTWSVLSGVLTVGMLTAFTTHKIEAAEISAFSDGTYYADVMLEGGSGRASIECPAQIQIEDGNITAHIVWSSPNYDYMVVEGEKYEPVNISGNSAFDIPVLGFDQEIPVIADTVAMSTPHEIEYTLFFPEEGVSVELVREETEFIEEQNETETADETSREKEKAAEDWCGLSWDHSLDLTYAEEFQVDYYEDGYARIVIADSEEYLVVPENMPVPETVDSDVTVLQQPLDHTYLVATSAMDLISSIGALDQIRLSGTKANGWYVDDARTAMEEERILYAGKYSAPDYELILASDCDLAIESTMIYHSPEVKENLESFGVPVLVEHSSYESHLMGRCEWLKLYGVLYNCLDEAERLFDEQIAAMKSVSELESTGRSVAFFYISTGGYANVRKSNDYVAQMIELAGGTYVFDNLGEDQTTSSVNLTMEEFYMTAKDADYIIYNSSIDSELSTVNDLIMKSELLADFKAVKEGNVWCSGKNLFQETTSSGKMIEEIHQIITDDADEELRFFHKMH